MTEPARRRTDRGLTSVELVLERAARRVIAAFPGGRASRFLVTFGVFGAKQAWACVFGGLMLAVLLAAKLWYPDDAVLARNDALTLAAVGIQVVMVATRLETGRELRVVLLFHVVGTVMELFKTAVGSWSYDPGGHLLLGEVPLYSGFMYAAVGSYMVRVHRLFDLRFERYPPIPLTAVVAAAAYLNFFTHHYTFDLRWPLIAGVVLVFGACTMHYRVLDAVWRMPLVVGFVLVALFIWLAENIATWAGAWFYPDQLDGWQPVSPDKLAAWFLLMIISVVLVTWVYPPEPPERRSGRSTRAASRAGAWRQ